MKYVPLVSFWVVLVVELDKERVLANIGRDALELESLETSPSKESVVGRGELAKILCNVLIGVAVGGGICRDLLDLSSGVLADGLV